MKRRALPLVIGLVLVLASCGSVQSKNDGGAGGAAGTTGAAGAAGTTGAAGTSGTSGSAGAGTSGGRGGASDTGGRGGGAGGAGGGGGAGGEKCGMATCAPGQPCCNASCGLCMQPGAVCTQQVCNDLRWYYTCGDRICIATDAGPPDAGTSLPPCGADQKLNGPCPTLGLMCDPRDNTCHMMFVCATEPSVCPL